MYRKLTALVLSLSILIGIMPIINLSAKAETERPKDINGKEWWIDSNIVREISVEADNTKEALEKYRKIVTEECYIEISNNAMKNKSPMYIDTKDGETKQIGYVITEKTEFEDRDNYRWSTQYIDLWVRILTVVDTEF